MQVAVGGADHDLVAHQAAQLGGDGGAAVGVKRGVADQREAGAQLVRVLRQERAQAGRARFLLALEQQDQAGGHGAVDFLPRAHRLDEGHQLALVVAGAAAADDLSLRRVLDLGIEGIAVPQVQRIDRLHVVVAVEEDRARPARGRPAHHHRLPRGVADRRLEPQVLQLRAQPFGGAAGVCVVGRIGPDRRDADEILQPFQRLGQVRVEPLKDVVQRCAIVHSPAFPSIFIRFSLRPLVAEMIFWGVKRVRRRVSNATTLAVGR